MSTNHTIKSLGFKDMHEDQVEAFLLMVNTLLSLADGYENEEIFESAHQIAEDAIILFGGNGIEVKYEVAH